VDTNWYSDTGATDHITDELEKLTMKEKYNGREKIHAANGTGMDISHVGHAFVNSPSKQLHLRNVLHVPSATKNLVSIHRLTLDNNVYVEFHPWYFYVKDLETKKVLLKGRCYRGLYPLVSSSSSRNKQVLSATKPSATRWHDRLGHPSFKIVHRILRKFELPYSKESRCEFVCDSCQRAKSHQLPYTRSTSMSTKPLELVFSDVWGPAPTSVGRFSYYVSFIDDFSKFSWIYLIKKKSEVFQVFQNFQTLVERKFDSKIIAIQTDWGGEYEKLHPFFFTKMGISHRVSCPHAHQQNGAAERKHRHIVEVGLALLANASMPLKFWDEAFLTATYLINMLPSSVIEMKYL
jgi:histone deacetylase 1/2